MADTPTNQLDYPQPSGQKPGCGWPVMQAVGIYYLETLALLRVAESAQTDHEASWFQAKKAGKKGGKAFVFRWEFGRRQVLYSLQNPVKWSASGARQ